jgi:hypothetical protein
MGRSPDLTRRGWLAVAGGVALDLLLTQGAMSKSDGIVR